MKNSTSGHFSKPKRNASRKRSLPERQRARDGKAGPFPVRAERRAGGKESMGGRQEGGEGEERGGRGEGG